MKLDYFFCSLLMTAAGLLSIPGCSNEVYCDCAIDGAVIDVAAGITAADIREISVDGPCGPLPKPLCGDACDPKIQATTPWEIDIRGKGAGVCEVTVQLEDGRTFERGIKLTESDGCCAGFFGDSRLEVAPAK
jgi:hypothetical protein